MDVEPVFLDTNILVSSSRPASVHFLEVTGTLDRLAANNVTFWISQQVLREYLAVVTRPQGASAPISMADALLDIGRFMALFEVATESRHSSNRLLTLLATYPVLGRQVHDANIVATMLDSDVHRLLTLNVKDFRRFADIITLEPLSVS